ncbi:hypothetical protein PMPD1_1155 [Paramixta manurensis]|uniref:Uncharacterized protein n=1 Tax=Paramixta manurensis TaxID=2740817 RepID=A0A6M8UEJ4_9GAMM|nr:hypothetical protein PMPD1_1155 [Erwiniaceae bacterium PD-1]
MDNKQRDEEESRNYPVSENMRWQRIEWRIQRVGYVVLFAIVIGGACGLISKGFLSDQRAVSADKRLQIDYERFGRQQSDMSMTIRLSELREPQFSITLSGEGVDDLEIDSLQPQPQHAFSGSHSLTLTYANIDTRQGRATIWFGLQPKSPGYYPLTVRLNDGSSASFYQWIYP